ncbi:MAG TPA: exodeoxyribonuclease VII small subunit [Bacillota bacterium]|nr:exodeoxyribonuclease VII small subunit [Bacillota bacterium]
MSEKIIEKMTFEQAVKELDQIVAKLEEGDIPLEKSLELFKRGITLTEICNKKLTEAQGIVKQLNKDNKGDLVETDFDFDKKEIP